MNNALIIWCHKAKFSITMYEHIWFISNNCESYSIIIYSDYLSSLSSISYDLMGLVANLRATLS